MPFVAADGIIEFPLTTCPVHPFSVFDTWHSFNSPRLFYRLGHRNEARYIDLFKWLVTTAIATGSYINIYLDPGDAVKMRRFNEMLEFIQQHRQTLTVATYGELVRQIKHGVVVEHAARDPQCIHEQRCI
jgi:hypothetical protein